MCVTGVTERNGTDPVAACVQAGGGVRTGMTNQGCLIRVRVVGLNITARQYDGADRLNSKDMAPLWELLFDKPTCFLF